MVLELELSHINFKEEDREGREEKTESTSLQSLKTIPRSCYIMFLTSFPFIRIYLQGLVCLKKRLKNINFSLFCISYRTAKNPAKKRKKMKIVIQRKWVTGVDN